MHISANVCKQILQRQLVSKIVPGHKCHTQMRLLRDKETSKTADNLFYVFKDAEYKLYKVIGDITEENVFAQQLNVSRKVFNRLPDLDFGSVGVFVDHGLLTIKTVVPLSDISGKLVKIKNLYMTAPRNVLTEK